jgi:hypothetical protein
MIHARVYLRHVGIAAAALGWALSAGIVVAQPRRSTSNPAVPSAPQVGTVALQPDLIADVDPPPAFIESYSTTQPCTPHSHTWTRRVLLRGRWLASLPAPAATLFNQQGQTVASWGSVAGSSPINLGSFTWTADHPCPSGNGGLSTPPTPPANNYRLVVDPGSKLTETNEQNNTVEFYVPLSAAWTPRQ